MNNVLLDTDVILDFFFDRQPFSQYSTQVISLCETHEINGFITPVIYSNLYYLLRQNAGHTKAIKHLKLLSSITSVIPMDEIVVLNALHSSFKDYEDGLQHYAAVQFGTIDVILTRNLKDYNHSKIGVLTPESYIKSKLDLG